MGWMVRRATERLVTLINLVLPLQAGGSAESYTERAGAGGPRGWVGTPADGVREAQLEVESRKGRISTRYSPGRPWGTPAWLREYGDG